MIESIENAFQLIVAGGCLIYSAIKAISNRGRVWILLLFFYAEIFLGNIYWQLYLVFFDANPRFPLVSELCWDISFAFLLLLAKYFSRGRISIKKDPVLLIIPGFTAGMALFYMQWGQIPDNIATAVLMAALILRCVHGLKTISGKGVYAHDGSKPGPDPSPAVLYRAILFFCAAQYLCWTVSCFFKEETLVNPYYWCDTAITVSFIFFIPALGRCVMSAKEQSI